MASLSKEEIASIYDSFSDEQKDKALKLKAAGTSPSWAIKRVQNEASQDEILASDKATLDTSLGEKLGSAGMGFAKSALYGAAPEFVTHPEIIPNAILGLAPPLSQEGLDDVDKARADFEAADEVNPKSFLGGQAAEFILGLVGGGAAKGLAKAGEIRNATTVLDKVAEPTYKTGKNAVKAVPEVVSLVKDVLLGGGKNLLVRGSEKVTSNPQEQAQILGKVQSLMSKIPLVGEKAADKLVKSGIDDIEKQMVTEADKVIANRARTQLAAGVKPQEVLEELAKHLEKRGGVPGQTPLSGQGELFDVFADIRKGVGK